MGAVVLYVLLRRALLDVTDCRTVLGPSARQSTPPLCLSLQAQRLDPGHAAGHMGRREQERDCWLPAWTDPQGAVLLVP